MLLHPALARARALDAIDSVPDATVEVRLAARADAPALVRLAQLDSALAAAAELPGRAAAGDVLVASSDGAIVAALTLSDGLLVSDPFHRTTDLVALLHARRHRLAHAERRRGRLGVLRPRHS
jgi:hypothetical protein